MGNYRVYLPTVFAGCFLFLAAYANSVIQVYSDYNSPDSRDPLPDLGHRIFPHWDFTNICDYWLFAMVCSAALRYAFVPTVRAIIFRRVMFIQGIMFCLRAISIIVTELNIPQQSCESTATGNPWVEGFLIIATIHHTCGDVMFSGHTTTITVAALTWTMYSKGEEWNWLMRRIAPSDAVAPVASSARSCSPRSCLRPDLDAVGDPVSCYITPVLVWAAAITGYCMIITTRFHYSVDVFIGFTLTQLVYRYYHMYIKTVVERTGPIASFVRWFEGFETVMQERQRDGMDVEDVEAGMGIGVGGKFEMGLGPNSPREQVAGMAVSLLGGRSNDSEVASPMKFDRQLQQPIADRSPNVLVSGEAHAAQKAELEKPYEDSSKRKSESFVR